jgi:hypothetical protein
MRVEIVFFITRLLMQIRLCEGLPGCRKQAHRAKNSSQQCAVRNGVKICEAKLEARESNDYCCVFQALRSVDSLVVWIVRGRVMFAFLDFMMTMGFVGEDARPGTSACADDCAYGTTDFCADKCAADCATGDEFGFGMVMGIMGMGLGDCVFAGFLCEGRDG